MTQAALLVIAAALSAALPPLTPAQKAHVDAIKDGNADREDGFWSLLENAATWDPMADLSAMALNLPTLKAAPAEYRGVPMLIDATFDSAYIPQQLERSGPWDGKLAVWTLEAGPEQTKVSVVLSHASPAPLPGTRVQMIARFYKVAPFGKVRVIRENGPTPKADTEEKLPDEHIPVFIGRNARVLSGALPALTEIHKRQLATTTDYQAEFDQGGLWTLVDNARTWRDLPMPAVPLVTDVRPLINSPEQYRGVLLRVEGVLVDRRSKDLSRGKLDQWSVRISDTPDRPNESVVCFLTNAPKDVNVGTRVRVVGRFYMVFQGGTSAVPRNAGENGAGKDGATEELGIKAVPHHFALLVGHHGDSLDIVSTPAQTLPAAAGTSGGIPLRVVMGVLIFLGFGLLMVKRTMARSRIQSELPTLVRERVERHRRERTESASLGNNGDAQGPPLPKDPIAALSELERRSEDEEISR